MKKTKIYMYESEWNIVIRALNDLRNSLIKEGRYTDAVDEILLKVIRVPQKKAREK